MASKGVLWSKDQTHNARVGLNIAAMDMWPGRIPDGDALVKAALQRDMSSEAPLFASWRSACRLNTTGLSLSC